jgi:hypothetical protein
MEQNCGDPDPVVRGLGLLAGQLQSSGFRDLQEGPFHRGNHVLPESLNWTIRKGVLKSGPYPRGQFAITQLWGPELQVCR